MSTTKADKFSATTVTGAGKISIDNLNVTGTSDFRHTHVTVANDVLKDAVTQTVNESGIYKVSYRDGDLIFKNLAVETLVSAVRDGDTSAYTLTGTENVQDGIDMGDPFDISLNLTLNRFTVHNSNFDTHETFYTTNLRVLVENFPEDWKEILKAHCVDYDDRFIRRPTVKFICNRQVSHEFVRHRVFSFAQESTRYCNYTKDKFNNELTFIEPIWSKKDKGAHEQLTSALRYAETYYRFLINSGWKPEQAATVLPNAIKTELIITGVMPDWIHFFDLRALGTTGKPHPQAQELALPLYNEFKEKGWL